MRKVIPIGKEVLTEEDYLRSLKFGGFSDGPIPQSEETKVWQREFTAAIRAMNADSNENAPDSATNTEQGKVTRQHSQKSGYIVILARIR